MLQKEHRFVGAVGRLAWGDHVRILKFSSKRSLMAGNSQRISLSVEQLRWSYCFNEENTSRTTLAISIAVHNTTESGNKLLPIVAKLCRYRQWARKSREYETARNSLSLSLSLLTGELSYKIRKFFRESFEIRERRIIIVHKDQIKLELIEYWKMAEITKLLQSSLRSNTSIDYFAVLQAWHCRKLASKLCTLKLCIFTRVLITIAIRSPENLT